jgi:hypothetical protein
MRPEEVIMKRVKKKIKVTENNGIFRVSADFENGFHLVPSACGNIKLAFWDEQRLKLFLKNFGFYPVICHNS